MKKIIFYAFCLTAIILFTNCKDKNSVSLNQNEQYKTIDTLQEIIERGAYLVNSIGCDDCHSPKKMTPQGPIPDLDRRFSGHPSDEPLYTIDKNNIGPGKWILMNNSLTTFVGPWGVSYGANLTPHETGIGNWTFDNFKTALREGKYKGLKDQRMLLPPMPWQNFKNLTDSDLRAMFEFFKTVKPIKNIVPSPIPPNDL